VAVAGFRKRFVAVPCCGSCHTDAVPVSADAVMQRWCSGGASLCIPVTVLPPKGYLIISATRNIQRHCQIELRSPNVRLIPDNERPWCRTDDQRQMWKEYAVFAGSPRKQPLRLCDGGDSSERSDAEEDAFSSRTSPEFQEHDPHNNEASVSSAGSTSEIRDDDSIAVMIMGTLNTPPKTDPTSSPGNSASTDSATPCPILCLGCQWVSQGDHSGDQVQCEKCRFWSHISCVDSGEQTDWNDPNIRFLCQRCEPPLILTALFICMRKT
jgi:hypothetical protein